MKNPYIEVIKRRINSLNIQSYENAYESVLLNNLLKEFQKIDKKFSIPFVSKLQRIASQCEAGGHKSRARMFRALAKEFEAKYE